MSTTKERKIKQLFFVFATFPSALKLLCASQQTLSQLIIVSLYVSEHELAAALISNSVFTAFLSFFISSALVSFTYNPRVQDCQSHRILLKMSGTMCLH